MSSRKLRWLCVGLVATAGAFENDLADPASLLASLDPASSGQSFTDLLSALSADAADPAATFTDLVNGISSAASAAYSTLLPLADIGNALLTSLPRVRPFAVHG